ncbi:hypothetical protein C8R44DRAFT_974339 [Mycena epipterygia]|nr:hypothetical protein C8R44DRAFT_974339 [Mycena epipterygia]
MSGPLDARQRVTQDAIIEDPTVASIDHHVCFLQVENHLFQVHLFHLLRDETFAFHDMFSMPSGDAAPEGFDRENPVILTGDTLTDICSFHTLAYSSPLQSQLGAFRPENLPGLTAGGLFAHKYSMNTFLQLALYASRAIGNRFSFNATAIAVTLPLLRLTWLCGSSRYRPKGTVEHDIRVLIQRSWILRLREDPSFDKMKEMLDLADTYDFRPLLGEVYHMYLLKITVGPREPICDPSPTPFPDPSLSELHRSWIMTGHWSLDDCWQRLAMNAPPVPDSGLCERQATHATACTEKWARGWRAAIDASTVRAIKSVDIFRKLSAVHQSIEPVYEDRHSCFQRSFRGLHPVAEYIRKLHESLADHFMGPLPAV